MFHNKATTTIVCLSAAYLVLNILCILPSSNGAPVEKQQNIAAKDLDSSATDHFESFEGFEHQPHHDFDDGGHFEDFAGHYTDFGDHFSQSYEGHHALSNDIDLHEHYDDDKPVPGIEHGKGAFSYSSSYEFKDKDGDQQHDIHDY